MGKVIERMVDTFRAKSDTGKIVTIIIMQEFIRASLAFGDTVRQESLGTKRLVTSGGRPVNMINETTYEVLGDLEKYIVTKI